jgi:hypothetical protein
MSFTATRWRRVQMRKPITAAAAAALLVALTASALGAAGPRELPTLQERSARHDVTPRSDSPVALSAGTYAAKLFPTPLRVTVPVGWRGGQGQSREFKARTSTFGWIDVSQGTSARAQGAITIVTSTRRTPSVAAVVAGLRSRGHGATYGSVTRVAVAGYAGSQFDGSVGGTGHVFVPFSPRLHVAAFYADAFAFDPGEMFRIEVIDIHGKTVVVFIESASLPATRFPAFLASAERILGSLRFPD